LAGKVGGSNVITATLAGRQSFV